MDSIIEGTLNFERLFLKKEDITAFLRKHDVNDKRFNPKIEANEPPQINSAPETTTPFDTKDSKGQPAKKTKKTHTERKPWSDPWAGLEYDDGDESGAYKFDNDRYKNYYIDKLQKFNVTEQEGKVYVMKQYCEKDGKKLSFDKIAERIGVSRQRATELYHAADGKICLLNAAKSKMERDIRALTR